MAHARSVIVLATGVDEAMNSSLPKVLHPLLGRTLLGHVLAAVHPLAAGHTIVVTNEDAVDQVTAHLTDTAPGVTVLADPDGDGAVSALRHALAALADDPDGLVHSVVVVGADLALLRADTVAGLVDTHEAARAGASLLTAYPDDTTGPAGSRGGRVVRNAGSAAVEGVLAPAADGDPGEVTAGLYVFDLAALTRALATLAGRPATTDPVSGDGGHITDLMGVLVADGYPVSTQVVADPVEARGCADRVDLAELGARLRDRVNAAWMRHGVTIVDPTTTWIDVTATVGADTVLEPGTQLRGRTSVGTRSVVGPECTLIDVSVGDHASVIRSHAIGATVGNGGSVGPYAYLRPGTVLHDGAKVGTFVEVKNSDVGAGTKIPHLSYVGDATIGEETNIGAANVVVNYDGVAKHRTVVGSHVRTGSDTMLVAPVTVGDGAYTAAGSVVTEDVPPGALAVARALQRNVEGWVAKRRSGTKSARAAAEARADASAAAPNRTPDPQPATRGGDAPTHGSVAETRTAMSRAASASDSAPGDTSSD